MRYTETRLGRPWALKRCCGNIGEATVDFTDNFDNSQQEPIVLPAQLPNLLLNGSSGHCCGYGHQHPPPQFGRGGGWAHRADRSPPRSPIKRLFAIIPGPDFPTGGEIIDRKGIAGCLPAPGAAAFPCGASPSLRKFARVEAASGAAPIVVTELPYQVNKAAWIEKVADLVNNGRIRGHCRHSRRERSRRYAGGD
jgi:DNA gyrase subunit A